MAAKVGGVLIDVAADVSKLVEGMNKAQQTVDNRTAMIKKSLTLMSRAIAVVTAVVGSTTTLKGIIDNADAIGEQSEALGIATEKWSKYIYTAKFAGVETGTLNAAFSAMIRRTNNFVRSGGGAAATALKELGISTKFARENFTSADKTFEIIIDKLSLLEDGNRKTAIAQDIFSKSASTVVRYANLGAEEIKRLGEQAEKTGNIITSKFAGEAGEVNDALDNLGTRFAGIGNKLVIEFTPAVLDATKALEGLLGVQREQSTFELKKEINDIQEEIQYLAKDWNKMNSELNQPYKNVFSLFDSDTVRQGAMTNHVNKIKKLSEELQKLESKLTETQSIEIEKQNVLETKRLKMKEEVLRISKEINKKPTETSASKKTLVPTYDYDAQVKTYEDFMSKKQQVEDEFNDKYKRTVLSKFEYEREALEKQKEEYLYYGQDKLEVDKWYAEQSKQINEAEAKAFEEQVQRKKQLTGTWLDGMKDAIKEYGATSQSEYSIAKTFFTRSVDDMSGSLATFVVTGKAESKALTQSIIADLLKIQIQKQLTGVFNSAIGGISSLFGFSTGGEVQKYATGGLLTGGSGVRDDLYLGSASGSHVFAMGGEYIVNKSAVSSIGVNTMDYINSTGNLPKLPNTTVTTGVNVQLNVTNESGTPIGMKITNQSMKKNSNGDDTHILNVVMHAAQTNKSGFRTNLKGILS